MLTLAIETSNPSGHGAGVALVQEGRAVDAEPLRSGQRHDDALMPAIDRMCARAGVRPTKIGRVAVSIGPGGYTALRIACATAKVICAVTGAQCAAVPTAAALRMSVDSEGDVVIALAYKRADCWAHHYRAGDPVSGGQAGLETFEALTGMLGAGVTLIAEQALVDLLADHTDLHDVRVMAPRYDALAVERAAAHFKTIPPEQLVPLYGREPEAVSKWRQLHGKGAPS